MPASRLWILKSERGSLANNKMVHPKPRRTSKSCNPAILAILIINARPGTHSEIALKCLVIRRLDLFYKLVALQWKRLCSERETLFGETHGSGGVLGKRGVLDIVRQLFLLKISVRTSNLEQSSKCSFGIF